MTTVKITITEALQEIKTIDARVGKKNAFVLNFLFRQNAQRDPHEKDGGSAKLIAEERQAIKDLLERKIKIRTLINRANDTNQIAIFGVSRTIAEWLVWRRDVAPVMRTTLRQIADRLIEVRQQAQKQGIAVTDRAVEAVTLDVIVNINENDLHKQIEELEEILGYLDGQLSLKNATIKIEV